MAINVRPENEDQQAPRPVGVFDQAFLTGVPDVTEILLIRHGQQDVNLQAAERARPPSGAAPRRGALAEAHRRRFREQATPCRPDRGRGRSSPAARGRIPG